MSAPPKASTAQRRPPAADPTEPAPGAPVVLMHGRVEVIFYPGPLPPLGERPLSKAELDFRWLIAGELVGDRVEVRDEFREWSASLRYARPRAVEQAVENPKRRGPK